MSGSDTRCLVITRNLPEVSGEAMAPALHCTRGHCQDFGTPDVDNVAPENLQNSAPVSSGCASDAKGIQQQPLTWTELWDIQTAFHRLTGQYHTTIALPCKGIKFLYTFLTWTYIVSHSYSQKLLNSLQ